MPCALDEIRKLGKQRHAVVASDTFRTAPGSHSRYVESWKVTASPRYHTRSFIDDVIGIVRDESVDLLLPAFEEAFYLAWHIDELRPHCNVFLPPFETLARLHDKAALLELARELGIETPRTLLAKDRAELTAATRELPHYFARAAYSRGGVQLLTNTGPLAGELALEVCEPTTQNPWLVQEFLDGLDVCTYSVAHHGRIVAHASYVHPREIEHAGGIVFESIHDEACFEAVRKIVEATRYNGQISFDFKRMGDRTVIVECNPRPTAGVFMLSPEQLSAALRDRTRSQPLMAEVGQRRKMSVALIRDMVLHWREIPKDLPHLLSSAQDVYAEPGDLVPALYQLLSYSHVVAYRRMTDIGRHDRRALLAAYFHDIQWDGEPLAPPRRLLTAGPSATAPTAVFEQPEYDDHEHVSFFSDPESGLRAIIAIHSSAPFGISGGGCRMWPYASDGEALRDVLRLSRAMSYKLALADMPAGGAKAVVIGDPTKDKSEALLLALGSCVERLGGRFVIAEDVGTTPRYRALSGRRRDLPGDARGDAGRACKAGAGADGAPAGEREPVTAPRPA